MKLETFDFNTQAVRVVNRDGEPWFVACDVCRVLDLTNVTESTRGLDADELDSEILNSGVQGRKTVLISESGLYALVFKSRKPEARKFRKWVTAEVLPAIRASGRFEVRTGEGCELRPVEVVSLLSFVQAHCGGWALDRQMQFGLTARRYAKAMGVCFQAVDEPGIGRVFGFARPLLEGLLEGFAPARVISDAETQDLQSLLEKLHAEHGDTVLRAEQVRQRARALGLFPTIFKERNANAQQSHFGRMVMRHAGRVLAGGLVIECHRTATARQYEIRREEAAMAA